MNIRVFYWSNICFSNSYILTRGARSYFLWKRGCNVENTLLPERPCRWFWNLSFKLNMISISHKELINQWPLLWNFYIQQIDKSLYSHIVAYLTTYLSILHTRHIKTVYEHNLWVEKVVLEEYQFYRHISFIHRNCVQGWFKKCIM